MASELKPCPFCQYKAHEWIQGNKKMACCDNMDCPCRAIVCTVEQWNTRPAPAATDTGLETVAWLQPLPVCNQYGWLDAMAWQEGEFSSPVCLRSQAVELLAAERHERDMLKADFNDINAERQRWRDRAEKAEADNAAKDARIKELEPRLEVSEKEVDRLQMARAFDGWLYHNPDTGTEWAEQHPIVSGEVPNATEVRAATATAFQNELIPAWEDLAKETSRRKALEAKLADAEKALERIAARDGIPLAGSFAAEVARAVLGGKPS